MNRKVVLVLALVIAAAFYFGYLKLREPSLKQIEQALPVQVVPEKERHLAEMKEKTKKAISAASKEMKKPDQNSNNN